MNLRYWLSLLAIFIIVLASMLLYSNYDQDGECLRTESGTITDKYCVCMCAKGNRFTIDNETVIKVSSKDYREHDIGDTFWYCLSAVRDE